MAKGVEESDSGVVVKYEVKGEEKSVEADYVLVTVGRRPNTDEIGLEEVGIEMTDRGVIKIDKQCRTNIPNIFAIGDIVDGPPLAHKLRTKVRSLQRLSQESQQKSITLVSLLSASQILNLQQ